MKYIIIFLVILNPMYKIYCQDENLQLGKSSTLPGAAVFDLSDPTGVNMEVSLWGFVRIPGRYKVPINTTFMDLMSYSGGPLENSNLEEIRVIRGATDTTLNKSEVIKLNYNDMLWEEKIHLDKKRNPLLLPGDIVIVMEDKRYSLRDNLYVLITVLSTIMSIATFIITLKK
jgi:hypothetical protein